MSDIFDKEKRSEVMSKMRSNKNKSTELRLIELFGKLDIKGWRRNYPVKGKPDFIFPDAKIAVFVDGCFWHGHDCRNVTPADNAEFWEKKLSANKERDKAVTERLQARGWTVVRIWECELKKKNEEVVTARLRRLFESQSTGLRIE
ncbi:MAG: very short patch repair endonuclease [Clostridiales bacterium]|nr:very short patch repair endonuclease [Clostridiales bacterium]